MPDGCNNATGCSIVLYGRAKRAIGPALSTGDNQNTPEVATGLCCLREIPETAAEYSDARNPITGQE